MVELGSPRRAPEMKMGHESVLTFAGIVANAGIAFVVTWLIARGLGAAATGVFFLLTSLFMIATAVIGLGADTGLVRALSRSRAVGESTHLRPLVRTAVQPVIVLGLAVTTVLVIAAEPLAARLAPGQGAAPTIRLLALALLPAALTGILLAGSRGLGRIRTYTVVQNLFIPICRLALVSAVITVLGTTWSVVGAWAAPLFAAAALAGITLMAHLRAEAGLTAPLSHEERVVMSRRFWAFSLPRGVTIILERALDWADVLLVIALLGPGPGGVYGVVTRIVQAGNMLEAALRIVLGPRISAAIARDDHARAEQLYRQATQLLILGSWPFYLAVALFADVVLGLFGPEFALGTVALVVLASAMALKNTAGALQTVLLMAGRSTWQLRNKAIQLAALLALMPVLVPWWGMSGAAIAFALSIVLDTLLAGSQVHRALGITVPLRTVAATTLLPTLILVIGSGLVRLLSPGSGALLQLCGLAAVLAVYGLALLLAHRRGALLDEPAQS